MKKNTDINNINRVSDVKLRSSIFRLLSIVYCLLSISAFSQVKTSIDSTSIKIGEELLYQLEVETDTTSIVVFPEGQTFSPLEVIESYKIDTTKKDARYTLIKKYGLTQFDSGKYTIPMQKVVIGTKTLFSDSLRVEVRDVVVDTTKQGLYDIKPIIDVDKTSGNWWKWLLYIIPILVLVAGLLYWFVWRKKPLTEEEKVLLLPPYERAQLALKQLDESSYLANSEIKQYYSELTLVIRKYLDDKVYDHSLESTTDELIERLNLLSDGNQIELSKATINNIESILKRADLVKFAKDKPNPELAKLDRKTIAVEIDNVKATLPEPTEEEKQLDQSYLEALEKKKKRRKIVITVATCLALLAATFTGFGLKYGFGYVVDTITGNKSKALLEEQWVTSEYGYPPITISTPQVLKREHVELPEQLQQEATMAIFGYENKGRLTIATSTTVFKNDSIKVDVKRAVEGSLKTLEQKGAQNIITKNDKFTTPNGAEGLKTHGTLSMPLEENSEQYISGNYVILSFATNNVMQQVLITAKADDVYLDQITDRILNSVELQTPEAKALQQMQQNQNAQNHN